MTAADPPLPTSDRQRLLLSCKALIFKWTSVHFKSYLEKLDQQLLRMAEKAGSNQDQGRLLQSRQELQQRRALEKQLLGHLRDAFDAFLHHAPTAADLTQADAELKLVDNEELEQSIAIAAMTRRASTDFAEALYALNQRLSVLGGGARIDDLGNPVARGEDTLKEIRQRVDNYLGQKVGGMQLPDTVRTLLYEPWANVLAFNLLRHGSSSPQWHAAAAVVDDVLNYLQPSTWRDQDGAEEHDWQLRSQLEEKLSAGFQTVGYDIDSGGRLLAALHEAHRQRREQPAAPAQRAIPAADIDQPVAATPAPRDEIVERLSALEFGTWFLFLANRPRKEQWEAKLAWSNPRTQHYMFVNRLGQQVAVKSGAELAADIRSGNTRILEPRSTTPFFEKALERIAEQLRRAQRR